MIDNNDDDRKQQSLKSKEADLKVIVGKDDNTADDDDDMNGGDGEDGTTTRKEIKKEVCWYIAAVQEVAFPDITPSEWEHMMKFLNSPVASRSMTGVELCDDAMQSWINAIDVEKLAQPHLLDEFVAITVLSYEINLHNTFVTGMTLLRSILNFYNETKVILTVKHIRRLVPAIDHYINSDHECSKNLENDLRKKLRMTTNEDLDGTNVDDSTSIDLLNPLFPQLLVAHLRLIGAHRFISEFVDEIVIATGTHDCPISGSYCDISDEEDGCNEGLIFEDNKMNRNFSIRLMRDNLGDWTIQKVSSDTGIHVKLFVCDGSRCNCLPPPNGWSKLEAARSGFGNEQILGLLPEFSYYHGRGDERKKVEFHNNYA